MGWRANPKERRARIAYIWAREQGRCFWCSVDLERSKGLGDCRPTVGTMDHIELQSKGGSSHVTNMVLSCPRCNSERGSLSALAWAGRVGRVAKLKMFRSGSYAFEHHNRVMGELYMKGIRPPTPPGSLKRRFVPR